MHIGEVCRRVVFWVGSDVKVAGFHLPIETVSRGPVIRHYDRAALHTCQLKLNLLQRIGQALAVGYTAREINKRGLAMLL